MKSIEKINYCTELTNLELQTINGGADASEAGEAVGKFVGQVAKGVLLLVGGRGALALLKKLF